MRIIQGAISVIRRWWMNRKSPSVCEKLGVPHDLAEADPWGGHWCDRCGRLIMD